MFSPRPQWGGLWVSPNRHESEHDWVENSHASTILSYAHGVATALEREGRKDRTVVAVLGDGSMTGGMAYEGLNNLGNNGSKVVIVLNDNGRSYAPTSSKLSESLTRLRLNPTFVRQRRRLAEALKQVPMGGRIHRGVDAAEAAVREMWEPPAFFEQLGVRYTGPIDGHDIEGVEKALRHAAED